MRWGGFALVAGAFLVVFGLGGLRLIFGVWMRPLEADFEVDRSAISLVAALSLLVLGLGQPLLGRQVDVRGPRLIVPVSVLLTAVGVIMASQMPSYLGFMVSVRVHRVDRVRRGGQRDDHRDGRAAVRGEPRC